MAEGPYRAPAKVSSPPELRASTCPYCGAQCARDARRCPTCDVDLARVRCASCLGLQRIGARECADCGAKMALEPLFDADGGPCPRCARPLALTRVAEVDLHECAACGGVFANHDALAALTAHRAGDENLARLRTGGSDIADEEINRLYVRCPQCDGVMNRSRFAPKLAVIVDACMMHGVWFDAGEITKAIAFVARGGAYEAFRHRGRRPGDPKPEERVSRVPASMPASRGDADFARANETSTGAQLLVELLAALAKYF